MVAGSFNQSCSSLKEQEHNSDENEVHQAAMTQRKVYEE